jgi:integrase
MPADPAPEDRVFPARRGNVIRVNADWQRVRERAGLPADLTLHGLRHSIGTVGVLAGMSAPEVQALLRHRNIATSAKYIHLAEIATNRLQDRATAHLVPDPGPSAEVTMLPAAARRRG